MKPIRRLATCPSCYSPSYPGSSCWNCGRVVPVPALPIPCPLCSASMTAGTGYCTSCDRLVDA